MSVHGESSKKAEKRSRMQREAAIVATLEERSSIRISEVNSNSLTTTSPNIRVANTSQRKEKKTRGPSKLRLHEKGKEKCEVSFNERDQPIGPESVKLSTLEGSLVRHLVPVTMKSWLDLPKEVEDKLWAAITVRYNLNECFKKNILKKLGKLWRNHKSILSRKVRQLAETGNATRHLALSKPENISMKEWKAFVKQRTSPEFKEKSEKFKKMRAQQTIPHTMSRRGYARLEGEMRKESPIPSTISRVDVWIEGHKRKDGKPINEAAYVTMKKLQEHSQQPSNQSTTSIREDALTHVLGPERRGQVRGLGFGALPSRVDAQIHQRVIVKKLQDELHALQKRVEKFEQFQAVIMRQNEDQSEGAENMMYTLRASQGMRQNESEGAEDMMHTPRTSQGMRQNESQHGSTGVHSGNNLEDAQCILLHWEGTGVEVAEGQITSINPQSKVHFVSLGPGCWKVWVTRILVENVPLFRPTREMFILDEALGTTIAWPSQAIRLE